MKRNNEQAGLWLLISTAFVLPFAAWFGFVVKTIWGWFVVPLHAPAIGVWEAAGLYLLIRLLTMDLTLPRDDDKTPAERFLTSVVFGIVVPATALGFAAIYHAFA